MRGLRRQVETGLARRISVLGVATAFHYERGWRSGDGETETRFGGHDFLPGGYVSILEDDDVPRGVTVKELE